MDHAHEESQAGGNAGARGVAAFYGAALGFGFALAMIIVLDYMGTSVPVTSYPDQLLLTLPLLAAWFSAILAKPFVKAQPGGVRLSTVLARGAALGAVCGFISFNVFLIDLSLPSPNGSISPWTNVLDQSLTFGPIGAVFGMAVGALAAAGLAWLLNMPRRKQQRCVVAGFMLGATLGAIVPYAALYTMLVAFMLHTGRYQ